MVFSEEEDKFGDTSIQKDVQSSLLTNDYDEVKKIFFVFSSFFSFSSPTPLHQPQEEDRDLVNMPWRGSANQYLIELVILATGMGFVIGLYFLFLFLFFLFFPSFLPNFLNLGSAVSLISLSPALKGATLSSGCLYAAFTLTCIPSPLIVMKIGPKWGLFLGSFPFSPLLILFLFPLFFLIFFFFFFFPPSLFSPPHPNRNHVIRRLCCWDYFQRAPLVVYPLLYLWWNWIHDPLDISRSLFDNNC